MTHSDHFQPLRSYIMKLKNFPKHFSPIHHNWDNLQMAVASEGPLWKEGAPTQLCCQLSHQQWIRLWPFLPCSSSLEALNKHKYSVCLTLSSLPQSNFCFSTTMMINNIKQEGGSVHQHDDGDALIYQQQLHELLSLLNPK